MPDPKAPARAAVLASTLSNAADPADALERLKVPGVLRQVRRTATPLDLAAPEFRYRVLPSREIVPLRDGVRHCGSRHRHR